MEIFWQLLRAAVVGGLLCVIAQILLDRTALTPARILVSYVVAGVLLGAIGLYPALVEFAGAGATVPLTGFGNLIATGVRAAIDEAMKSNQTFLREAAADAEMQAEIIRCTAEKEAAKEAAVLENDAADKLSAAISLVLAEITHRTDNGTR